MAFSVAFCRASVANILVVLTLTGCEPDGIGRDWHRAEAPVAAPEFTLPMLEGGEVRLADYRGRVVIMEFWATWCGPCRYSLPSLETVFKKYQEEGVSILLINEGENTERIRKWAKKRFTAPILLDARGEVGRRYKVNALPRLFVVDQAGQVIYSHSGYGGGLERNLKLIIEELLAEEKDTAHG